MPRALYLLLAVQFISAVADNAFLIVTIARLVETGGAAWLIPLLKLSAVFFYVLLAPFVGPLADTFPKGRVMVFSNALKVMGSLFLIWGSPPEFAIAVVGLGAAMYAPAKYGLITELLPATSLVRANGYLEGVTVTAVIVGTVTGGVLVGKHVSSLPLDWLGNWPMVTDSAYLLGMVILLAINASALVFSYFITDSGVRYDRHSFHPVELIQRFLAENKLLWRDPMGGISMAVTTLLWAVGATLQLLVLSWASYALGFNLEQAAYLQGVSAIGVVVGSVAAGRYMTLAKVSALLPFGMFIGAMVPMLLLIDSVIVAVVFLFAVGALAGFFVVPMNAMLQHRGCTLLTAGRSIAVQGCNENGGILLMLALYSVAIAGAVSMETLLVGFGVLITTLMAVIWLSASRKPVASAIQT
jgi:MFS family permease